MDWVGENFCRALKRWFEENYKGTRGEFADELGVSYQHICNVLTGRRCGDEVWRRKVAERIGVPYENMIGLDVGIPDHNHKEPETSSWVKKILPSIENLTPEQQAKLIAWLELEGAISNDGGRNVPTGEGRQTPVGRERSPNVFSFLVAKERKQRQSPALAQSESSWSFTS